MGDIWLKAMTRIHALVRFNRRERLRKKFALYLLLVLLTTIVFEEGESIIEICEASTSVQITASVLSVKAGSPVANISEVALSTSASENGNASNSQTDIISQIKAAFPKCPETMVAIAHAESHFDPNAVHHNTDGTDDVGILQINSKWGFDENWLKNPINNIAAGRIVYEKQGLRAWETYDYAMKYNLPI